MTIGTIYASLFGVGVVYALLTTVLGALADHDIGGIDADAGGGIDQPHPISGTVVATFISGFGGGGVIAHYLFAWSLVPGLFAAVATGAVMAGAAFLVLEFVFSRTQAGSEFKSSDASGRGAEVITAIPDGRMGEIAYLVKGQREQAAARAVDGRAIAKGTPVVIETMMGPVARVRPQEDPT